MSLHPSLASATGGKQQKSVLKRSERIKHLIKKGLWKDDSPIFGLPKIKALRIKIKKEKTAEKQAEAQAAAVPAVPEQKTKGPAPKK